MLEDVRSCPRAGGVWRSKHRQWGSKDRPFKKLTHPACVNHYSRQQKTRSEKQKRSHPLSPTQKARPAIPSTTDLSSSPYPIITDEFVSACKQSASDVRPSEVQMPVCVRTRVWVCTRGEGKWIKTPVLDPPEDFRGVSCVVYTVYAELDRYSSSINIS